MFEPVNNFSHSNICSWQTVIMLVSLLFSIQRKPLKELRQATTKRSLFQSLGLANYSWWRDANVFNLPILMSGTCAFVCNLFGLFSSVILPHAM